MAGRTRIGQPAFLKESPTHEHPGINPSPRTELVLARWQLYGGAVEAPFSGKAPAFFPASVAPVVVGSAWGFHVARQFDWIAFLLGLAATVCVYFASNVLNDVGDDAFGTDRFNDDRIFPYTGGSRFIQNGLLSC
jgi:hypothetical protein